MFSEEGWDLHQFFQCQALLSCTRINVPMSQEGATNSTAPAFATKTEFRKATPRDFQPLETSWDNWIKHFACCANASNWSKQTKVVMLSTKLVGKAFEEYECLLDENEQIPFDDLVKAIGKEVRP